MSKSKLTFLAVLIGVLMIAVYFAGFDSLPRGLRSEIASERTALTAAQSQLRSAQDQVLRNLEPEAALFRGIESSQKWPEQLSKDLGDLQLASRDMEQLSEIEKQNRRQDKDKVES